MPFRRKYRRYGRKRKATKRRSPKVSKTFSRKVKKVITRNLEKKAVRIYIGPSNKITERCQAFNPFQAVYNCESGPPGATWADQQRYRIKQQNRTRVGLQIQAKGFWLKGFINGGVAEKNVIRMMVVRTRVPLDPMPGNSFWLTADELIDTEHYPDFPKISTPLANKSFEMEDTQAGQPGAGLVTKVIMDKYFVLSRCNPGGLMRDPTTGEVLDVPGFINVIETTSGSVAGQGVPGSGIPPKTGRASAPWSFPIVAPIVAVPVPPPVPPAQGGYTAATPGFTMPEVDTVVCEETSTKVWAAEGYSSEGMTKHFSTYIKFPHKVNWNSEILETQPGTGNIINQPKERIYVAFMSDQISGGLVDRQPTLTMYCTVDFTDP